MGTHITDTALIFEGGGMRGAYTAAMVRVLLKENLFLDWVAGISAGSSHLINYVSRDPDRGQASFTDFASDKNIGNWSTFLRGQGYFNSNYIYRQTAGPDQPLPFDFETFASNPAQINIGGFNASTGEHTYWTRDDIRTLDDLVVRVQASSSLPVFMPMVDLGGHKWVDGALGPSGGIALDAAKDAGFTKFLVICSRTRDYVKKPAQNASFLRRHFRRYPALAEAILQRAENYNRTKDELLQLESHGSAYVFFPDTMPISINEKSVPKLRSAYATGYRQSLREIPAIKEFLGV